MSATVAAAVKAAIVILSNEEARKKVGWGIVAILSPLIVLVVLLCAILSGTSQHNVSAVELCFHGGSISASATPEYQRYIEDMRNSFDQLDEVIAEINSQCEDRMQDEYTIPVCGQGHFLCSVFRRRTARYRWHP